MSHQMTEPVSLGQIPLFSSLSSDDLEEIGQTMRMKRLKDGDMLFCEGDVGTQFYIVILGELEVIKAMETPEERLLSVQPAGGFVGEMALLGGSNRRTASIRARGLTVLMELRKERFEELLQRRPSLGLEMLHVLSERLRAADESTIEDLQAKNVELSQAYEDLKAAQAEIVEKEKLEHELNMARNIQESILPQVITPPKGIDVGAKMIPARAVGGDFFDVIPLDDNKVGVAIGDVSDKGVPAALFMAQFCTLLRIEAQHHKAPEDLLQFINNHLLEMNQSGLFVTTIYGIFDIQSRTFTYARAGHEVPVIFNKKGEATQPEHGQGTPLCIFPDPPIDVQTVKLPKGSTLLMYTDGGTDAMNAEKDFFGLENLQETFAAHLDKSAQDLCEIVLDELIGFQEEDAQFDDATLVAIRAK
jgi:sigma-B regulation protein RsbU (phosphoserine phosphatase)